jgi:N-acetylglucosamine-6-phosphate deacetylase
VRLGVEAAVIGGVLTTGDVEILDGRIARVGLPAANGRGLAVPGFVDLQVNGFGGVDFLDADQEGYRRAGEALLETGVTAYLPTLITSPEPDLLAALAEVPTGSDRPRVLGAHLEGPFISPLRLGAHGGAARRDPDLALAERLLDGGPVVLMTLAPELPDAGALIDRLLERGITVSFGHSDASAEEANAGFDRGVRTVTHLFNAMPPLLHPKPGLVGAALARDDVIVQIILDGVHLAPETAQVVRRAARGRVALVTDAITAAGLADGRYSLGGRDLQVENGVSRGPNGELAGSVLTMIEAVRNLHALGAPLLDAIDAATAVPARVLGNREVGRLAIDLPADVVVLDDRLEIVRVLVGGEVHVAA